MRPELLETDVWEVEEGNESIDHWVELIESNTTLTNDDVLITVSDGGETVDIQINADSLEIRYVRLIVVILLKSIRNAGGDVW